jgi:hypothetical protein
MFFILLQKVFNILELILEILQVFMIIYRSTGRLYIGSAKNLAYRPAQDHAEHLNISNSANY